MLMLHQGLAPGVQRREDAGLRSKILGVRQQGTQGVADRLKQQRRHHLDVDQPQRVERMGQGKDDMGMITGQESGPLQRQPALGLEVGTLGTRPMPTGVVPDAGHMAIGTRWHMAASRRRPALHDGAGGSADVGGERVHLLVGGKRVLEEGLERHEGHRCLRPRRVVWA
jgi:hypothetical protein